MVNDLIKIASASMSFGAAMEFVVVLIGYVVRVSFSLMKGGEKE